MPTKKVPKKNNKKTVKKTVTKKTPKKVAKKTVKKTVKKSPKKTASKRTAKTNNSKPLVYAENQKSFWVTNGQILNSLVALRDALDEMEKEVYQYHAGTAQNDFAAWVDAVLADQACAKDLQKAKTPKSAKTIVVRHLKTYTI